MAKKGPPKPHTAPVLNPHMKVSRLAAERYFEAAIRELTERLEKEREDDYISSEDSISNESFA
jgi:hypothetical protein